MLLTEKTKAKLAAMSPERRANVLRLVAEKLTNMKLRELQRRAEEGERQGGAEPGSESPASDER